MRQIPRLFLASVTLLIIQFEISQAGDLSPAKWNAAEREQAEKRETGGWSPSANRSISSKEGVISAIASPIAVQAGIEALRQGGTAADAAGTIALTQITTQLGSVVSYAGIMTMVYYDAKTGKVYSLDAGYQTYRNETDPQTIPQADMGPLNQTFKDLRKNEKDELDKLPAKGRETLVPGFMAGVEALHQKFGRLPFPDLFQPAIWYAEQGVKVNASLAGCFQLRKSFLMRTPEGKVFLHQAGNEVPTKGDLFKQPELANTLRQVAKEGAQYMYSGAWGREFVKTIQREGGKVLPEDLTNYRVIWSEPHSTEFAGHRVYTAGEPSYSAYNIFPALNLIEEFDLIKRPPFWKAAGSLMDMQRINNAISGAPAIDARFLKLLKEKKIDASPAAQLTKAYAKSIKPLIDESAGSPSNDPHHSNSIVVVDKYGNIAAITHTINSVIWGDTGIVVGGIPIPDSAGFQQARLATLKPGSRLPNEMVQTIVLEGNKPILATAAIGAALIPETIKLILSVAGQGLSLEEVQAAPAYLSDYSPLTKPEGARSLAVSLPEGLYGSELLNELEAKKVKVKIVPSQMAAGLRGTVAAVKIDPKTGVRSTTETQKVLLYGGGQ
ncbi:gamma-glutamyltransferase [Telmatocola sphagniphila]|uniref:Gamma-glutamyltransferase n=1 Tax=Telmatocola sphagniphila TaxID=1123043 RepID=A0A8E6B7B0_9BACT|nr:gamma-glutamyltransferase [Telmatocola sphagniphila]QVL32672.1 gamma-glutamyltransferase [Telmatocola sphagniphila]